MDRYLDGESITEDALLEDLHRAMARGTFFPVVPACSTSGVGCGELLDLIVRGFPAPSEHPSPATFTPGRTAAEPVTCDPQGPLVAEVVKTTSDPYVGRVSLVRVFSGTLDPDRPVHVSGHLTSFFGAESGHADHDDDERIGSLSYPFGQQLQPASRVVCGDLATVGRLTRAETGDTLSSVEDPRVLRPWSLPTPLLPVAIEASTKSDEDKLSTALTRLAAEDPSLRVDMGSEQLVLWTMGEAHADAALERLRDRFGVSVDRSRSWCRCGRRWPPRAAGSGGTSSSPVATASTPSARSRSSRSPAAPGSSSPSGSSAAPCRGSSSPASRRASAPSWPAAAPGSRWSTSGSRSPAARRTASTPPTWPSRAPVRWRCARRRGPPA